ncbi:MAG TPA: hypothetical protein VF070_30790 [Streptosporangiaceae bacterium]
MSEAGDNPQRLANLKQLGVGSLRSFSGGFSDLERVVRELKPVVRSLEPIADPALFNAVLQQWGQLEIIYALVLEGDRFSLTPDEETSVREVVARLLEDLRIDC